MRSRANCSRFRFCFSFLTVLLLTHLGTFAADVEDLESLVQTGQYEHAEAQIVQAVESLDKTDNERIPMALLLSQLLIETGRSEEAQTHLQSELKSFRGSPDLWARLAKVHFLRGEYQRASSEVNRVLGMDSAHLEGRFLQAQLLAQAGHIEEAISGYRWFVRHYNRTQPTDWTSLIIIGEAAAEYARLDSVSAIFNFLVNDICPDALKDNPECWQAAVLSGTLLLEKYNDGQALPEFDAALKINPKCADALTKFGEAALVDRKWDVADAFADRALAVNSQHLEAILVKIDRQLFSESDEGVEDFVSRAIAINPNDQRVLARRAYLALVAVEFLSAETFERFIAEIVEGEIPEQDNLFSEILSSLLSHCSRPGQFFSELGIILESRRKYLHAEACYDAAIQLVPQLAEPRTQLGMLYMRTGRLELAQEMLDAAFDADPFHVRVSNMRKVLNVLDGYQEVASDHFVIRVSNREEFLGQQMSDYLEEIHDELAERYGYEPPVRTQFEIYSDAKEQPAHAWFSARMVGLPWIQTIGASTGMIVALTSPLEAQEPFHWGQVLRHEYVHILTLQKTGFNIPHWYTEALAVIEEGTRISDQWQDLLLQRVPRGDIFDLSDINSGFRAPQSPDDWQLAYCQSRLYADYFRREFGDDALSQLLKAFVETPSTEEAILKAFGTPLNEVEAGYKEYLTTLTESFVEGRIPSPPSTREARRNVEANPDSAEAHAELSYALLRRRAYTESAEELEKAMELNGDSPLIMALDGIRLIREMETDQGIAVLQASFDNGNAHPLTLTVLATLLTRRGEYDQALVVLKEARQRYPSELSFLKLLANAMIELPRDGDEFVPVLESVARREPTHSRSRTELARLFAEQDDAESAAYWAREALFVDPADFEMVRILGEARKKQRDDSGAIRTFEILMTSGESTIEDRLNLARLYKRVKQPNKAKTLLHEILVDEPSNTTAKTLLKLIDRGL